MSEALADHVNLLERRVDTLEQRIEAWRDRALNQARKARKQERRVHTLRRSLRLPVVVRLGRELQRQGYLVAEHPAFGGVHPVHADGSYHYAPCTCAIDVNWPNRATEPRHLDRLNARLRGWDRVVELIWRAPGHYDHLHVAVV
jgi:hypothetical protein